MGLVSDLLRRSQSTRNVVGLTRCHDWILHRSFAPLCGSESSAGVRAKSVLTVFARPTIERIPAVDGLRGVAVLMVVGFHCFVSLNSLGVAPGLPVQHALWTFVTSAVDLFFVISGFVITSVLDTTRNADNPVRTFYARRALRIVPLYYGFLLITMPFLREFPALTAGPSGGKMWEWLFLTNIRIGLFGWATIGNIYRHFWTIAIEEQYYIVWPWVVLFLPSKRVLQICAGLICLSVISRLVVALSGHPDAGFFLTPMRLDGLAAGSAVALLRRRNSRVVSFLGGPALIPIVIAVIVNWLVSLFLFRGDRVVAVAYWLTMCPLVFTLFYASVISRLALRDENATPHWLEWRPLVSIARYSYGMYAVHALLISLFVDWAIAHHLSLQRNGLLYWTAFFVAIVSLTYAIGMISWKFYESVFLRRAPKYQYLRATGQRSAELSHLTAQGDSL